MLNAKAVSTWVESGVDTRLPSAKARRIHNPTDPKSIYVDGNPVHVFAEKPPVKQVEESKKTLEDFPF